MVEFTQNILSNPIKTANLLAVYCEVKYCVKNVVNNYTRDNTKLIKSLKDSSFDNLIEAMVLAGCLRSEEDIKRIRITWNAQHKGCTILAGVNYTKTYQRFSPFYYIPNDDDRKYTEKLTYYVRYGETTIMSELTGVCRFADSKRIYDIIGLKERAGREYLKRMIDRKIIVKQRIVDKTSYHYEYKINPFIYDKVGWYGLRYIDFLVFKEFFCDGLNDAREFLYKYFLHIHLNYF